MSKVIFIAQDLAKTLKKIKKKDPARLHKLKGELRDVWSISVGMQYRLLFKDSNEFYFFAFGTHKEVYDKGS